MFITRCSTALIAFSALFSPVVPRMTNVTFKSITKR